MAKYIKLMLATLFFVSATIVPIYAQQEPCEKCKVNPDSCKLIQTGKCDDCKTDDKTIEKKVIVKISDVDRGFLGVMTEKTDRGLVIVKVVPESPADKAGLKKDNIIISINKDTVNTPEALLEALKGTKPKDVVTLKIKSEGKEKSLDISLAEVPKTEVQIIKVKVKGDDDEDIDIEMPMMPKEMTCPKCGAKIPMPPMCPMMNMGGDSVMGNGSEPQNQMPEMSMMPMQKEVEKNFMVMPEPPSRGFMGIITSEEDGKLVIDEVNPNSPAEKAGLKEDDIISEINGTAVSTPSELIEVLKATKPGDVAYLKIVSSGNEKMVDVILGEVPAAPQPMMPAMPIMRSKIGGRKPAGRGAGYFGPGFTFFKFDDLNTIFSQHNMNTVGNSQFVFSGGGWGQAKRIRLGGYGMGGAKTVSNDTLDIETGYGAGFFELGYAIVNAKNLMITPTVGIGGYSVSLKITPKINRPTSLSGLINSPWGIANVSKGGFAMYPGLAIDIPFGFVGITLKGGYMWSPMSSAWNLENLGSIGNDPDVKLNGPFVTAGIMFGGGSHYK